MLRETRYHSTPNWLMPCTS